MDFLKTIAISIGLIFISLIILALPLYFLYKYDCYKLGENVKKHTEYHFFGGECLVEINGEIIPAEKWINNSGN